MIMNEKIKASEVTLTGLDGEPLGVVPTAEALAMAKKLKVDLVCTSLAISPPPCRLIAASDAKREAQQARKSERPAKVKEIRLTPHIEEHDLDTKRRQAETMLKAGDAALFVVRIQGKEAAKAKELLDGLIRELKSVGKPKTGVQTSGKQVQVQLDPL
ncbi:translation initiation factor IF-3 [Paenibacillus flagellatus]|uniref:Translation initiation factor IF-3 n=1 Tax=Paenibacillus flagellatus TaxID=2211139 RepID=A0A2V5K817_9BACL|nr:translation initiation factor IF-3 [Paenibacillus flagellatus]PYI55498.1 translation initiation factor IF-3 [Paenibacillus flagellatus]